MALGALASGWAAAGSRAGGSTAGLAARASAGTGTRQGDAKDAFADAARSFRTDDAGLMGIYDAALAILNGNILQTADFPGPVLVEGAAYPGIWQECGPQEGLVYGELGTQAARAVARNNHLIFFALQKPDGQLPYAVKTRPAGQRASGGAGWGQIQMVVPIAATALELAQRTGDSELLEKAYAAGSRWDAWLRRSRNTRGTGLCEGFCTWDTGMDNSPRWADEPNSCPDGDARHCPDGPGLPRLCPDLSATVYGGRVGLAAMAHALGKTSDADRWAQDAAAIRQLIVARLYSEHDGGFCDLDAEDRRVAVRSAATLRVLGEHVPDAALFAKAWQRQVHNPKVFWAPWPFPSVALDDPQFVRPIPRNSWGGAAQALTALRAPRWMEHYGKPAELAHLMQRWMDAIRQAGAFRQQMDPLSGVFTEDAGGYSPAALVFFDFLWRLSGVREQHDLLEWNVRPPAKGRATFAAKIPAAAAELRYGVQDAELWLSGQRIATVSGVIRVTTTRTGELREAVGIAENAAPVKIRSASGAEIQFHLAPNERIPLRSGPAH